MHKIITAALAFCLTISTAFADNITKTIHSLGINTSAVSVSVKNVKNGSTVYSLNSKIPMNPASTLKLITSAASLDMLGEDYVYETKLYKSTNNDLYLKLSGDPFLKSSDISKLIETAKQKNIEPKNIYIDDNSFDNVEWGEGWQWDDDLNALMPKFSIYNLDGNLVNIEITPINNGVAPSVIIKPFYPITVMNMVTVDLKSNKNDVKLERNNSIAPNVINISGTISNKNNIQIPVNNPKMYFKLRLEDAIKKNKLEYYKSITTSNLPDKNIYLVDKIENKITDILPVLLKSSDNLAAETLFKTAGSVWAQSQGTSNNSLDMLQSYLNLNNLKTDDIRVVDGSGVSKNNLVTSEFMTDFLVKNFSNEDLKDNMPVPGEGTLKNRMLYFRNNLKAKTGTLSDTSAIAGYIQARNGETYAFDIMIRDAKTTASDKKNIEEQILRQIYMN